jgi:hypothetical protein
MEHFLMGFEQIGRDVATGQNFERQRGDEAARAGRHDHGHIGSFSAQQAK